MGGDQFDQRGLLRGIAAAGKARLGCPAVEFAHRQQPRIDAEDPREALARGEFISARPEGHSQMILHANLHQRISHPASQFVFEVARGDAERGGELVRINISFLQFGPEGENFRRPIIA